LEKTVNEVINKTKVKTTIPPLAKLANASNPLDIVMLLRFLTTILLKSDPL